MLRFMLLPIECRIFALISIASCEIGPRSLKTVHVLNLRGGSALANLYRSAAAESIEAQETYGVLRQLVREDQNSPLDADYEEEEDDDDATKKNEQNKDEEVADSASQASRTGGQSSKLESEQFPAGSGGRLVTKAELKAQNLIDSESSVAGSDILGGPDVVQSESDDVLSVQRFREACQARMEASRRFLLERVKTQFHHTFSSAREV